MNEAETRIETPGETRALISANEWSPPARLLFRFVFSYSLILLVSFAAFFAPLTLPIAIVSDRFWQAVMPWVATQVLGVEAPPLYSDGDGLGHWIQMGCWVVFALLATLIWSGLDRQRKEYATLYNWLWVILRYAVGLAMVTYGLAKVFHLQMLPPHLAKLVQPLGESSPTSLLWIMMGSSAAYSAFTGFAEVLGGVLLFNRRTTTLGACITLASMAQVVALNLSYDVSVKLWSMNLFALALVVLAPDLRRMLKVLVLNEPSRAVEFTPLFRTPMANRIAFRAGMTCLVLTLAFRFVGVLDGRGNAYNRTPVLIYGIYEVESYSADDTIRPPLLTDIGRWHTLVIERSGLASIRYMNDEIEDYLTRVDPENGTVSFIPNPDETVTTAGATRLAYNPRVIEDRFAAALKAEPEAVIPLEYFQLPSDRLGFRGKWQGESIEVRLRRLDETRFLLLNRGFHWVQEYPYFR